MVTGRMQYVDDIALKDMLHLSIVRSPYSFARINSISGGISWKDLD